MIAHLKGRIHPSDSLAKIPGFTSVYYTKLLTIPCLQMFPKKDWDKLLLDQEALLDLLTMELLGYMEKGISIVISAKYDLLTKELIDLMLSKPIFRRNMKVIIIGKEDKECVKEVFDLVEKDKIRPANILINKIPAAEIMNVREDILQLSMRYEIDSAFLIPLTKQLYYRDFSTYTSVMMRARDNPHAKSIEQLFKRMVGILVGREKGGKLLALIGGLLNVTDLSFSPSSPAASGSRSEASPYARLGTP
jgi:hypothetical protein